VVRILIANGANVQTRMNAPVRQCALHGVFDMLELLIQSGALVNEFDDEALRIAASFGHADIVQVRLLSVVISLTLDFAAKRSHCGSGQQ
jgi:hypothetical protein